MPLDRKPDRLVLNQTSSYNTGPLLSRRSGPHHYILRKVSTVTEDCQSTTQENSTKKARRSCVQHAACIVASLENSSFSAISHAMQHHPINLYKVLVKPTVVHQNKISQTNDKHAPVGNNMLRVFFFFSQWATGDLFFESVAISGCKWLKWPSHWFFQWNLVDIDFIYPHWIYYFIFFILRDISIHVTQRDLASISSLFFPVKINCYKIV